ncbi:urease accessory protein UreD [Oceanisphaera psychrotolerans]|uniref:Urease accessory protein UreD n=1 Tax=Oceanisphaera psychrotolerans TaxID=1414654 RepID=A0A1J4QEW4_9GAMM|nr:urease accessory protein UreD [Oceanisphaera psychrotolerans]OIN12323.1 hypothetical protein BFR47_01125 [Oceanisphaera psychrotolerans]
MTQAAHTSSPAPVAGYGLERRWLAELTLGFAPSGPRTALAEMRFHGPLRVQRPFYPEGPVCHVYLLHPPGGLVSGDRLGIDIACRPGSHALVTTPSAGKIYQSDSDNGEQHQQIRVRVDGGVCEWLPQETIVFNGANGRLSTRIDVDANSRFIGWDLFCLGRPACDERFERGQLQQQLQLWCDGEPLYLERQQVAGGSALLDQRYGFGGQVLVGTLLACGFEAEPEALIAELRAQLDTTRLSVTYRNRVLVIRYLGDDGEHARTQFTLAWQLIRPELLGLPARIPRIWLT